MFLTSIEKELQKQSRELLLQALDAPDLYTAWAVLRKLDLNGYLEPQEPEEHTRIIEGQPKKRIIFVVGHIEPNEVTVYGDQFLADLGMCNVGDIICVFDSDGVPTCLDYWCNFGVVASEPREYMQGRSEASIIPLRELFDFVLDMREQGD